jgi:hypothetical protein
MGSIQTVPTNLIHSIGLFLYLTKVELIHRELFDSWQTVAKSVSRRRPEKKYYDGPLKGCRVGLVGAEKEIPG